jgi:cysteine desulfurase/selenocysteine lyase
VEGLRAEFPVLEEVTYLNHASIALVPKKSICQIEDYLTSLATKGPNYQRDKILVETARKTISRFLGCEPSELAFVSNTSSGISLITHGLK